MSKEQYQKLKQKEAAAKQSKNFGAFGPQSFKSRSLQAFQQDLEKGKATHLMPVMNAKKLVKEGKLKEEDIPYMQRLGSWDNSDLGGGKKKKGNASDAKYKSSDAPSRLDWSGRNQPRGPVQPKQQQQQQPKKKLFGLF